VNKATAHELKRTAKVEPIHVESYSSFLSPYQVVKEDKERGTS